MEATRNFASPVGVGLQVLFGALFVAATYVINLFLHGNADFRHSLAVGGSQLLAFYAYCYVIRSVLARRKNRFAGEILLLFTVVLPFLGPVLVYFLFPLFGVSLQLADAPFDLREFFAKVLIALKTVWVAAGLYYVFYAKEMVQQRLNSLEHERIIREKERVELKNDLLLHASQSHYAKHVMTDLVAHAASVGDRYTAEQVAHIGKTFDYVAEAAWQSVPIVSIHKALAYFHQVAVSIRLRRGGQEGLVAIEQHGEPTMQVIGPLTLTTLLENCDTHGLVNAANPIRVRIALARGKLEFRCVNSKRPTAKKHGTSGQGLALVKQELGLLARHDVRLEIDEDERTYAVCLTISYQ